jgi:WD40 repeat protein
MNHLYIFHFTLECCLVSTDLVKIFSALAISFFLWGLFVFQNGRISSMDFHSKATNYLVTACDDESIRLYDIQNAV